MMPTETSVFSVKTSTRHKNMEAEPAIGPLKTLEEVLSWKPPQHDACVSRVPLQKRVETFGPRTLVCHDMKGGYLEDRFAQGSDCDSAYVFYHWQHIDEFVYFAHEFVTIPPPAWTDAAHRHGCMMLGTIITEWENGRQLFEAMLSDDETWRACVRKFVEIAKHYNMDGWLLNVENTVKPEHVSRLVSLTRELTEQMHQALPGSKVLWYDSVTREGKLKWQNKLNDLNKLFFDVSDGIFLNYVWTPEGLEESASLAGSRQHDVYVGGDVFGRNCPGGGGFNTKEVFSQARKRDLSVAIFAPAWVYEVLGSDNFIQNENKFWSLLQEYTPARQLECSALSTSFCLGRGPATYCRGTKVREGGWSNMRCQELQPSLTSASPLTLSRTAGAAYTGGSALQVAGPTPAPGKAHYVSLFENSVKISEESVVLLNWQEVSQCVDVSLVLKTTEGEDLILHPTDDVADAEPQIKRSRKWVLDVTSLSRAALKKLSPSCVNGCSSWNTNAHVVSPGVEECGVVREVGVEIRRHEDVVADTFSLVLGSLVIEPVSTMKQPLAPATSVSCHDVSVGPADASDDSCTHMTLTCRGRWELPAGADSCSVFYRLEGSDTWRYLMTSHTEVFHLCLKGLERKVQAVDFTMRTARSCHRVGNMVPLGRVEVAQKVGEGFAGCWLVTA